MQNGTDSSILSVLPFQHFPELIQFFVGLVASCSSLFLLTEMNEPIAKRFYTYELKQRSHDARYQNVVEIAAAYSLPNCMSASGIINAKTRCSNVHVCMMATDNFNGIL